MVSKMCKATWQGITTQGIDSGPKDRKSPNSNPPQELWPFCNTKQWFYHHCEDKLLRFYSDSNIFSLLYPEKDVTSQFLASLTCKESISGFSYVKMNWSIYT